MTNPVPAAYDEPSDAELLTAVRGGQLDAYGQLYARHAPAALRLGRALSRDRSDVDDLVSETFAKVLATLRGGHGPDLAFRAYLLTTMRNVFYDRARRDKRIEFHDDLTPYETGEPFVDTTLVQLERSYAARAFAKLPERWRLVLWHTEVEGESPAQVAPLLGLTPNGVSALAYRARERLRQMYLQEHITDTGDPSCHWAADRLAGSVRGGLPPRDQAKVDQHLAGCRACHLLHVELAEVNSGLRNVLGPLVLGSASAAYLKSVAGAKAAATAAASAGVAGWLDHTAAELLGWILRPVDWARRLVTHFGVSKLIAATAVAATAVTGAGFAITAGGPHLADGPRSAPANPATASAPGASTGAAATGQPPGPVVPPTPATDSPRQSGIARSQPPASGPQPGSTPAPNDFQITALTGKPLVAGAVGTLSIRIKALESAAAGQFKGTTAGSGGGSGSVGGEMPAPVALRASMPAGMTLAAAAGGDGWRCQGGGTGAICTRASLNGSQASTVNLQVSVSRAVAGLQSVPVSVSAGVRRGLSTLRLAVAPAGTSVVYAATGPNRLALTGNSLLACLPRPACVTDHDSDVWLAPYVAGPGDPSPPVGPSPRSTAPNLPTTPDWLNLPSFGPLPSAPTAASPTATSAATLDVPTGSTIAWAGLFWANSGRTAPTAVALRGPGQGWHAVTANRLATNAGNQPVTQAFADVTELVGGGGTWWFAAEADALPAGYNEFAGWSLVVVLRDTRAPITDTAVYAGPSEMTGAALAIGRSDHLTVGLVSWAATAESGPQTGAATRRSIPEVAECRRPAYRRSAGCAWRTVGLQIARYEGPTTGTVRLPKDATGQVGAVAVSVGR